ncbi:MAG TPA: APC family permease [Thermoanaerobaculaceae bacterium]|nr:APC family permease [Thermoanaerobaculaceae bacterium]
MQQLPGDFPEPVLEGNDRKTVLGGLKRALVGGPKDPTDPAVFHKLSLVAFLAWVGLGADGLSSSSYGPDEAFRAILGHQYLALYLAALTTFTVLLISYSYSFVVEHFPSGGGGYVVASKLLGPIPGVVSGSALVVDYLLTITLSICSGVDAILSFLPLAWQPYKVPLDVGILLVLLVLNLRGVKESVKILLPIFLVFIATHVLLIGYGVASHLWAFPEVVRTTHIEINRDLSTLGFWAVLMILLRADSLGAGTYTGIEAVSNGLQILKEPRIATAKRTMAYMALSLAFTAGGLLVCYLLWQASPAEGKTMNAVLLERVMGLWTIGGWSIGTWLVIITLISEGALLFVAAQTGFIDGPRVLSNMATDSWMPHAFANLSERLVTKNGVVLLAVAAAGLIVYSRGRVSFLVVLYAINVFITFSLTQLGMARMWLAERKREKRWLAKFSLHVVTLALCVAILLVTTYEKLAEGGWLTFTITSALIALCLAVHRHYRNVQREIAEVDRILTQIPIESSAEAPAKVDPNAPVAILFVSGYGGLGIHAMLSIQRLFPNYYKNVVFLSVGVVDSGHFKGRGEVESLVASTETGLQRYVDFARRLGVAAEYRYLIGTDVIQEAQQLSQEVHREFPKGVFFLGKLVFANEKFYYRFLHNDTAFAIQRRLQFSGLPTIILPIRMRLEPAARAGAAA